MFLGEDYENVAKHCTGYELVRDGLPNFREETIARKFEVDIKFLDPSKIDRSKPTVLTVPSLNADGTHAVYWDGRRIWDPNSGREGKNTFSNQRAWEMAIEGYQRA